MGGLSAVLGGAAAGFSQAAQEDRERAFRSEEHRRAQLGDFLGKLANDETAHPHSRQAAIQEMLALQQAPFGKPYKFDIDRIIAPYEPQQTLASQGPTQSPSAQLTIPPLPPGMEGAVPGRGSASTVNLPATPQQGATLIKPERPAGIFKSPDELAQEHAHGVGMATQAQLGAQITARQQALAGSDLPPDQQAALALGVPGYFGAMNRNAVSGTDTAANLRANGIPVPATISDEQYVKASQTTGGGWHFAPTVAPPSMVGSEHHGWKEVTQADGSIVLVPVTESTSKVQPGGKKGTGGKGAAPTPAPKLTTPTPPSGAVTPSASAGPTTPALPALTAPGQAGPPKGSKVVGFDPKRADKSYQFNTAELDRVGKPIEDSVVRFSRLKDTLAQGTPQADALVAPELLTVMAGGQGSGLRMNEAEISRIIGGRSHWESLKAAMQKWSTDPEAARSITSAQHAQISKLMDAVNAKLSAKQELLNNARDQMGMAQTPEEHRQITAKTRRALANIDAGMVNMRSPTGHTKTVPIEEVDHYKSLGAVVTD